MIRKCHQSLYLHSGKWAKFHFWVNYPFKPNICGPSFFHFLFFFLSCVSAPYSWYFHLFPFKEDLPEILKNKKQFAKLTTDWNNAKIRWETQHSVNGGFTATQTGSESLLLFLSLPSRAVQPAHLSPVKEPCTLLTVLSVCRSQASTGPQAKQDGLREEVEEAWRRLAIIKVWSDKLYPWCRWLRCWICDLWPQSFTPSPSTLSLQDQYSADLYHFASKEEDYANYFIQVSSSCDDAIFVHSKKEIVWRWASKTSVICTANLLVISPTVAAWAAGWVPQKLARVSEQKHQRTQRESQPKGWGSFAPYRTHANAALWGLLTPPPCVCLILQGHRYAPRARRSMGSLWCLIWLKATETLPRPSKSAFTCCWERAWEKR